MICFLISVILMISSYFLMISFIYSVLTNIIIDFHGNHVIINLTNSNLITKQGNKHGTAGSPEFAILKNKVLHAGLVPCMQALFFDVMGFSN